MRVTEGGTRHASTISGLSGGGGNSGPYPGDTSGAARTGPAARLPNLPRNGQGGVRQVPHILGRAWWARPAGLSYQWGDERGLRGERQRVHGTVLRARRLRATPRERRAIRRATVAARLHLL